MADLPKELREWQDQIEKHALDYGLDFYQTIFEILDFQELNQVASYGGFPTRYPHWSYGMEYERLSKSYSYGLSKIYEMVINNDPVIAYLLKSNSTMDQKLVMAHVFGHADFFKNNFYFSHTERKALDMMANHGVAVRRIIEDMGPETVENFLDICLSIDNLIDPHNVFHKTADPTQDIVERDPNRVEVGKLRSDRGYMEKYINPPDFLEDQKKKMMEDNQKKTSRYPAEPEQDVLQFLINHAPLENWQRKILGIIRKEAYYFLPQGQTKTMNEGWASYWHSTIMTKHAMTSAEVVDYADHHSGTVSMAGGRYNPYKIGIELFRDIEARWNQGKFGADYEACDDVIQKKNWNTNAGLGREKIFEVRKVYNDITFLDEFLTPEFCAEHKLFTFRHNPKTDEYEIASRDFSKIKKILLQQFTNMGRPRIFVVDANYENRGELYLWHQHEHMELKIATGKETIKNVFQIWKRPVYLQSVVEDQVKEFRYDGEEFSEKTLSKDDAFKPA